MLFVFFISVYYSHNFKIKISFAYEIMSSLCSMIMSIFYPQDESLVSIITHFHKASAQNFSYQIITCFYFFVLNRFYCIFCFFKFIYIYFYFKTYIFQLIIFISILLYVLQELLISVVFITDFFFKKNIKFNILSFFQHLI